MYDLTARLDVLASLAHAEGGWGYVAGQPAHMEPTVLGLLALSQESERFGETINRAQQFLDNSARGDGTYRLARGRDEAVWPTALVLFAQSALGLPREPIGRTAAALLAIQGRDANADKDQDVHDIDLSLKGWPWAEGNFSWAEPTAWACLALRRAGHGHHERVEEGLRLLLDRASDEGGINYGNRRILGRTTEPIPGPTAIFLLALQGQGDHPRVAAAVQYLLKQAQTGEDLEHLSWARIALDVHRAQLGVAAALPALDERIRSAHQARLETPWVRPSPHREALTALALGCERTNPFRLPEPAPSEQPVSLSPGHAVILSPKRRSFGERLKSAFQGFAIKAAGQLRQVPPKTAIHIARTTGYQADLADVVRRQYETFRDRVPLKGKRVVLKPNLVEYHRDKVINTNPNVAAAVIELCQREGAAEVIVAEGPGHWRNVEYLVQASGLGDVLRTYKVPFIDLNHDEPVKTPNLGRLTGLEHLFLSRTVASAEVLISLPKLKTHHWAGATLSLKNLFGTLPGVCYGWPKNELHWRGIDNSIVDIALTRTPDLAIVDGIIGMEGDGPLNGTPKVMGTLIMGNDPLAVDASCCRMMQLNPERIAYLGIGYQKKLGQLRAHEIEQRGETIESVAQAFETVEHFRELRMGTAGVRLEPEGAAMGHPLQECNR